MAVDNWFQNWHPPFVQQIIHEPIRNYSNDNEYHSRKKSQNSVSFLPVFLSLNLLKSEASKLRKGQQEADTYSYVHIGPRRKYKKKTYTYEDNTNQKGDDDEFKFRLPPEYYRKFTGHPKSHQYSYTDSLGFPDPFEAEASKGHKNETYEEEHHLKPLEVTGPFKTWYRWKTLGFAYPSELEKSKAIAKGDFIQENNLPLGIEVYKNRIFISMPKWRPGVPATLAQLPRVPKEESPDLLPYPSWLWHSEKSCDLITSVFRMQVDSCGRLWVLDSGKISITTEEAKQHCAPKLLIFDLETDELMEKYVFAQEFIKEDSLYSNIVVDIRDGDCHDAYAYMSDVWRFGIVVFRLSDHKAWRITDHLFYPDPLAASYRLHELKFEWMDGIFGIALSPEGEPQNDRLLYFHPMSSFREFYVKTSYLRTDGRHNEVGAFKVLGQSRGPQGHVSSSVVDDNGIMYYNLVTRDSIGCWDSRKPYKRDNLGVIAKSENTLVFPNDMRLDQEKKQSMWILTNRLPYYLIEGLDVSKVNFRVMSAYTEESIKGTICDPNVYNKYTYLDYSDETECY